MAKLPKLKVKYPIGYSSEEICEFEQAFKQARDRFGYRDWLPIILDDHVVTSYEELVQLASQDKYKDREFLEVEVLMPMSGG